MLRRLRDERLVEPFDDARIDCASYRLALGEQVFVTKDQPLDGSPEPPIVKTLSDSDSVIVIRPGQFAFLLTQEVVTVPRDAMALISMRAGMKFRGLINVSGFHVDPGFTGKLIFGVYNAGPAEIYMSRGEAIFLIVFASLDKVSDESHSYKGGANGRTTISSELVQKMTGQVFSPMLLQRQMEHLNASHRSLGEQLASMKGRDFFHVSLAGIALAFIGAAIAASVAVTTSDWAKASAGMWIQGALDTYRVQAKVESAAQQRDALPNSGGGAPACVTLTQQFYDGGALRPATVQKPGLDLNQRDGKRPQ